MRRNKVKFFPKIRPKKQKVKLDKKEITGIIEQELAPYIKREELEEYLAKIEKDKNKKRLWDSLSTKKKIKVLKYALARKVKDGKK